jgi:hypothetical protein
MKIPMPKGEKVPEGWLVFRQLGDTGSVVFIKADEITVIYAHYADWVGERGEKKWCPDISIRTKRNTISITDYTRRFDTKEEAIEASVAWALEVIRQMKYEGGEEDDRNARFEFDEGGDEKAQKGVATEGAD